VTQPPRVVIDAARPAQKAPTADKPGHYELAVRLKSSMLNPGELVQGELFITGYGRLDGAKLTFYPSSGVFAEGGMRITHDLRRAKGGVAFGGRTSTIPSDAGCCVNLNEGWQLPGWKRPTLFFDTGGAPEAPQIATEATIQGEAPISFQLRIRRSARPGTYPLQFFLTYFDGESWQASVETVTFTVRTLVQRRETEIAIVAAVAAVVTVVPPIVDFVSWLIGLIRP
jgi:hypothetical protein